MTLTKYRPSRGVVTPFNDLFSEFFNRDLGQLMGSDDNARRMPSVNVVDRKDEFHLEMMAPGFTKSDISITVEGDTLTIAGEQKHQEAKEDERYTRREFTRSSFTRSFTLPEDVKSDNIKAEFKDGILHLGIPKTAEKKPAKREIKIG